jgi:hypothetical protein
MEHPATFAGFPPAMSSAMLRPQSPRYAPTCESSEDPNVLPGLLLPTGKVQQRYPALH